MTTENGAGDHPGYIGTMTCVCAVAVVLNILVIVVIGKASGFRTSVEILVTNLAVDDILQAGVVLPVHFKNVSIRNQDFYGGSFVCKLVMFIPLLTVASTICTIICIAGDRYRVMFYKQTLNRIESTAIVCLIWLVSFCVSAPQLYEYNIYKQTNPDSNRVQLSCGSEGIVEKFETIYAAIVFVLLYCLPVLVLAFCYIRISALVWKNAKRMRSMVAELPTNNPTNDNQTNQLESMISTRKVKVLQMLISITVAFVLLWTPYFILFAVQEIMDMDHVTYFAKWPHTVSRTMTVLSTVTNPMLYLAFSDPFRKALVTICGRRPTSNHANNQTSVQETSAQPMTFINTCICCPCRLNRVMPGAQPSTTQSTV